jgi:hypothetical protein
MGDADARADACAAPSAWPQTIGLCLTRLFLPLEDRVLTADVTAENAAWLTAHLGKPLEAVGREQLLAAIRRRHGAALLDEAIFGLARRFPELSAQQVITQDQAIALCLLLAVGVAALALAPLLTWRAFVFAMTIAFCFSGIFRGWLGVFVFLT